MSYKNSVAVILAGGSGTRFWPLSTPSRPKQFITLYGDKSMLQHTYSRVKLFAEHVLVVTSESHVDTVKEHLPDLPHENIVGEPYPKDTAAAITTACWIIKQRYGNVPMVILPADHLILDREAFTLNIVKAIDLGDPCCFGIVPTYPETGYGYIESGPLVLGLHGVNSFYKVKSFREKPDYTLAKKYVDSKEFLWNCGVYVFQSDDLWQAIETHIAVHAQMIKSWYPELVPPYSAFEKISIDYAVIEKLDWLMVYAADFDWRDIGGWHAVEELYADESPDGNSGLCRWIGKHSKNNFIFSEDRSETVMLIGVDDLIIVRSGNKTLVARKDMLDNLKSVVEKFQG